MYKFVKHMILFVGMSALAPSISGAQTSSAGVPAPVPAPLITSKTLFIGNGGGVHFNEGDPYTQGPDRAYNELYLEMKKLGRFRLVTNPSEADLICEISLKSNTIPTLSAPRIDFSLHATLIDPKTHVVMWAISTEIEPANKPAQRDKNFDKAMQYIVVQIKVVTGTA